MSVGTYLKKRFNLFLVSFIFIVVALIITFVIIVTRPVKNVYFESKSMVVTLDGGKNGLKLGSIPMSLEQGKVSAPNNLYKIKSTTKKDMQYEVIIKSDTKNPNSLDVRKVAVCLNDECEYLTSNESVIYEDTLKAKEEKELNIKIFSVKELLDTSDQNKSLLLNVEIKEKWEIKFLSFFHGP